MKQATRAWLSAVIVVGLLRVAPLTAQESAVIAWPQLPSPVYHDGRVYIVKNGGILTCLDASTGKRLYRKRIGSLGTHYASPILSNQVLFIGSAAGHAAVVDISSETPEILARNDLGEQIFATAAIIDNTLLVRTARRLYAIAAP